MEPFPLHTDPLPLTASSEPPPDGSRAEGNGALALTALDLLAHGVGSGAVTGVELDL